MSGVSRLPAKYINCSDNFKFAGMIQQLFLHGKKNLTRKKKIFTTTTEYFEYKHKTTVINIEETHIIYKI